MSFRNLSHEQLYYVFMFAAISSLQRWRIQLYRYDITIAVKFIEVTKSVSYPALLL